MTKFCSTFHEILTFKQNRARKQEVGHYDLILLKIFYHLKILINLGATNALYKILAKYIKWFKRKADFSGLVILATAALFDFRAAWLLFF